MTSEPTVFVVDDDEAVRDSLRALLESDGLKVETFASGAASLEAGLRSGAGCALLDLNLPGMSGLDDLETLGQTAVDLPVILITGRSDAEDRARVKRAGAIAFLDKPIRDQTLMDAIDRALKRGG